MDTVSGWVELFGAGVTAGGLVFAWNRASNRRLRGIVWEGAQEFWQNLARAQQIVKVDALADDSISSTDSSDVEVHPIKFDDNKPLAEQVADHLTAVGADLQRHRVRIEKLVAAQQAQADSSRHAIEQAVSAVQTHTIRATFCDLSIALAGISITMLGIFLGLVC
ncbi:hypothetical protein ACFVMC_00380 [Nocardia sp. NPDC127579]|uniref:hypothetical protein n=1 Tax=Nocardia sp. NPDC127579 TaxID=3345402 RepID=UPI0036352EB5